MIKEALLGADYRFDGTLPHLPLSGHQKDARELFLNDIHAKGKYIEVSRCPFCGAADLTKVSERDSRGLPCEVAVCDACGGCF